MWNLSKMIHVIDLYGGKKCAFVFRGCTVSQLVILEWGLSTYFFCACSHLAWSLRVFWLSLTVQKHDYQEEMCVCMVICLVYLSVALWWIRIPLLAHRLLEIGTSFPATYSRKVATDNGRMDLFSAPSKLILSRAAFCFSYSCKPFGLSLYQLLTPRNQLPILLDKKKKKKLKCCHIDWRVSLNIHFSSLDRASQWDLGL